MCVLFAAPRLRWLRLLLGLGLTGCGAIDPAQATSAPISSASGAPEHHHHAMSAMSATSSAPTSTIAPTATAIRSDSTSASAPTTTATSAPMPAVTAITMSGSGEQASANFTLRAGLALFHYDHPASTPFGMFLMNARGDHLALLANGAAIDGVQSYGIPADGEYYLHVIAEDGWSASVEQPRPEELTERAARLGEIRGDGPAVSEPIQLQAGSLRLSWQQRGSLPFEVTLWDVAGRRQIQIVSASMAAAGATMIEAPEAGVYVLNVQSNGAWTIALDADQD